MNSLKWHTVAFGILLVITGMEFYDTNSSTLAKDTFFLVTLIDFAAILAHAAVVITRDTRNRRGEDIELNTNIATRRQQKIINSFDHLPINSLKQLEKTLCFDSFPKEIQDIKRLDSYNQEKIKDIYKTLSIFYQSNKFRSLIEIDFNEEYSKIAESFVSNICNKILVDVFHLEVDINQTIEEDFSNHQEKIMSLFCQDTIQHLSTLPENSWSSLKREDLVQIYNQSLKNYTEGFLKKLTDTQEANDMSNNIDIVNAPTNTSKDSINSLGESKNNKTITHTGKQKQVEQTRISV